MDLLWVIGGAVFVVIIILYNLFQYFVSAADHAYYDNLKNLKKERVGKKDKAQKKSVVLSKEGKHKTHDLPEETTEEENIGAQHTPGTPEASKKKKNKKQPQEIASSQVSSEISQQSTAHPAASQSNLRTPSVPAASVSGNTPDNDFIDVPRKKKQEKKKVAIQAEPVSLPPVEPAQPPQVQKQAPTQPAAEQHAPSYKDVVAPPAQTEDAKKRNAKKPEKKPVPKKENKKKSAPAASSERAAAVEESELLMWSANYEPPTAEQPKPIAQDWSTVGAADSVVADLKQKLAEAEEAHAKEREESRKKLREYKEEVANLTKQRQTSEQKLTERIKALESQIQAGVVASGDTLRQKNYVQAMKEKKEEEKKEPKPEASQSPEANGGDRKKGKAAATSVEKPKADDANSSKKIAELQKELQNARAGEAIANYYVGSLGSTAEELTGLQSALQSEREKSSKLARQLAELKKSGDTASTSNKADQDVQRLTAELDAAKRELATARNDHQGAVAEANDKQRRIDSLIDQLNKLSERLEQMEASSDQLRSSRSEMDQLRSELDGERRTVADLRSQLGRFQNDQGSFEETRAQMESQMKAAEDSRARLEIEFRNQKQTIDDLRAQVGQLESENASLNEFRTQAEDQKRAAEELRAQKDQADRVSAELRAQLNESSSLAPRVAELTSQLDAQRSELEARIAELTERLSQAEDRAKQTTQERDQLQSASEVAQQHGKDFETERGTLNEALKDKEDQANALQQQLAEEKSARADVVRRLEEVNARIKDLESHGGGGGLKFLLGSSSSPSSRMPAFPQVSDTTPSDS